MTDPAPWVLGTSAGLGKRSGGPRAQTQRIRPIDQILSLTIIGTEIAGVPMRNLVILAVLFIGSIPVLAQKERSVAELADPPSSASWTFNDGNDIWTLCNTVNPNTGMGRAYRGFCMGYIKGVADVLDHQEHIRTPKALTNGQLYDAVMAWLSNHPEQRHLAALDVIYLALRERFPTQ